MVETSLNKLKLYIKGHKSPESITVFCITVLKLGLCVFSINRKIIQQIYFPVNYMNYAEKIYPITKLIY